MVSTSSPRRRALPATTPAETLHVIALVALPLVARGLLLRRPRIVRLSAALDLDRRAVVLLERLRDRYGDGPLRVPVPGRRVVVVLDPAHVADVLDGTPEPFSPATREKRAALRQFQPHGVLISDAAARPARRDLNERVLATGRPVHPDAPRLLTPVSEELGALVAGAQTLTWDGFAPAWWRAVRTLVLGPAARDDDELTEGLRRLRAAANWSFLHPTRSALRRQLLSRLETHLTAAAPGSLAHRWAAVDPPPEARAVDQVPQWLFAFDAAGMVTARALALLATHPDAAERGRAEAGASPDGGGLPYLRSCVLESARLWPTTPAVLRETTRRTSFAAGPVPERTLVVLHAPYLHRTRALGSVADEFRPDVWAADGTAPGRDWIPFSAGPASCAGRDLVLQVCSQALAVVVRDHDLDLLPGVPRLVPGRLPATLDPFSLRFALRRCGPPPGVAGAYAA